MDSSNSSTPGPVADEPVHMRGKPSARRASSSSTGSRRSRSSSSSHSSRSRIVVSEKRRTVILALRYVISQKEYAFIRRQVLSKAPASIAANTPTRAEFDAVVKAATWDDFLPASSRAGLRMFLLCNVMLNWSEYIAGRLRSRKQGIMYDHAPCLTAL
jgi:hypothetical protein